MDLKMANPVVSTGPSKVTGMFTWKIKDFPLVRQSKLLICSQVVQFSIGETSGSETKWRCFLVEETTREWTKWIGIYFQLEQLPPGIDQVHALFHVSVVKEDGSAFSERTSALHNYVSEDVGKLPNWYACVVPQSSKDSKLPLIDGELTLKVKAEVITPMAMPVSVSTYEFDSLKKRFQVMFTDKLQQDLGERLRRSKTEPKSSAPVNIICGDNKTFDVDRAILSARSPVFEKMFETGMKESKSGVIHISDISAKTIEVMLRFIYTGTLMETWKDSDVIPQLVYAADKYQFPDLLEFLDMVLGFVCCKQTAGRLLSLATKMSLKNAERDLKNFMTSSVGCFEDIISFARDSNADVM